MRGSHQPISTPATHGKQGPVVPSVSNTRMVKTACITAIPHACTAPAPDVYDRSMCTIGFTPGRVGPDTPVLSSPIHSVQIHTYQQHQSACWAHVVCAANACIDCAHGPPATISNVSARIHANFCLHDSNDIAACLPATPMRCLRFAQVSHQHPPHATCAMGCAPAPQLTSNIITHTLCCFYVATMVHQPLLPLVMGWSWCGALCCNHAITRVLATCSGVVSMRECPQILYLALHCGGVWFNPTPA
jgi:hypothetical protein